MPRLIPVSEWALLVFGDHKPHPSTLLRWVHDRRIQPQPKKIGRAYFVDPKAEYVEAECDLLERTM
ncbi:excisionase [Caballeronia glebae]|uniref:excisionase n=1 Tax=Caballeronia glebae TaxID=1777143 RepID=UPI0038BC0EA3